MLLNFGREQWRILVLASCVGLLLASLGYRPDPTPADRGASRGTPVEEISSGRLPEFDFKDLSGNSVSSRQFRGKVLLLDVWATWCPPCKEEMPWFQEFYDKYKNQGFEVVGVSIDALTSDIVKFTKEAGVSYPIVRHPEIMREWGLLGLPATFIVDRDGRIRKKVIGFDTKETFETAIRDSLMVR